MTVLVLGAQGQLGSCLVRVLEEEGFWVMGAPHGRVDVTSEKSLMSFVTTYEPGVIVNCAAFADVDGCEADSDRAMAVNALGAANAARAASHVGAKLVHISTDYVFDGSGSEPLREWDAVGPLSVYGKSKLLGEQYAARYCRRSLIVRTAWLYGGQGPSFVRSILEAAREGKLLRVVEDQVGSPTLVDDLCAQLARLIRSKHYGVYHCAGVGACSRYDFARAIVELAGLNYPVEPCKTAELPRPAARPAYSALDNMLLRCTVGDGMRPWREALAAHLAAG